MADADVVIIGAGLAGSAAAWALSTQGRSVVLLDQYEPDHAHGSSHGSARIVRRAYGDVLYTRLTGRAFELWREVEAASGQQLLRTHGGLDFGPHRDVASVAAHLAAESVEHEVMPASEAEARWPGMRFEGDVVFHAQAGTMDSGLAVRSFTDLASAAGVDVRHGTRVESVSTDGVVLLADGSSIAAGTVVIAAGGWVTDLAAALVTLPPIRVTQQDVFHFPRLDADAPPWPSVIHGSAAGDVYHLAGGRDGGARDDRKIGLHEDGAECTPATRSGQPDPGSRTALIEYVRRWLPGLDPTPSSQTTCLYTRTPSEDFLLDRVGSIVLCSPCSGHGAKFAPLIGELVAGLVTGSGDVPDRFRLAAHASAAAGAVSL